MTKLEIQFAGETRFDVPTRQIIRSWKQLLSGTRFSLYLLTIARRTKPCKRRAE
jgi:hypothetical protein